MRVSPTQTVKGNRQENRLCDVIGNRQENRPEPTLDLRRKPPRKPAETAPLASRKPVPPPKGGTGSKPHPQKEIVMDVERGVRDGGEGRGLGTKRVLPTRSVAESQEGDVCSTCAYACEQARPSFPQTEVLRFH
jgi:hypothetical protein